MAPDFTFKWLFRRVFVRGLWEFIFLIPAHQNTPTKKGAVLGILPWLSSAFIVFPLPMKVGFLGLYLGIITPKWSFFFAAK